MAIENLFDRGVSFRGDLSYFDVQQKLTSDDIMVKDYLGIGEQARVAEEQFNLIIDGVTDLEGLVDFNFQYLHGDADYSPVYDPESGYTQYTTVTYEGNEYSAINEIPSPAGEFDPNLWRQVSTQANHDFINETRDEFLSISALAAYGGLTLSVPPVAFPDITGVWQTVNIFDSELFVTPRGITQSVAGSSLSFEDLGVYEIVFTANISHNADVAARSTSVKLYNVTAAADASSEYPVYVAINQTGTMFNVMMVIDIDDENVVGDEFVIQVGSGSTLSGVTFNSAEYYIKSIGEYRGEI